MEVELEVFSGQPNPRWTLSDHEAAALTAELSSLYATTSPPIFPAGLGFRGFRVRAAEGELGPYRELRVYHESVIAEAGGKSESFIDPARRLERILRASAAGHVDPAILSLT